MRHSSYSTTADTYTHVMPAHSAEAVREVAALFHLPSQHTFRLPYDSAGAIQPLRGPPSANVNGTGDPL